MLRSLRVRAALVLVFIPDIAFGPSLLSAQQASPTEVPSITIRATTRLVVVDVVVTNKQGQPVPGLKAEDFTVEENGKKQKIFVFVPPLVTSQKAPTAAPPGILPNLPYYLARPSS